MFFLTRDGDIEILHSDDEWEWGLFNYANQCLYEHNCITEELDVFGRNFTDKLFRRLCTLSHIIWVGCKKVVSFQSLSCKKVNDQYIARLELSNETLEMELSEMVALLEQRLKQ
jgi:hypothetical protein